MNTFNELSKLVLLGTERQPPPAPAPGDALTAQLDPRNREHFVLSAAAIAFQYERAGALAPRDASPEPEPCPAEEQPRTSHRAANALQSLFEGERGELLPEWLRLAANARQVALPEVLPGLLTLGATKPELRDAILPVLGERGRWLAKQNAAWTWPAGAADEESVWDTGEAPVRALFLQRLSRTNPSRARELVSSTWATDPPEERAAFLRAFAFGLSPADEPFLEAALDDKRKEVRRIAADLLAKLPESAFISRMKARAMPLLKFVPADSAGTGKGKKSKKPTLEIDLPAGCDKSMQRDGIEPKPIPGFGEKIGWLAQMLQVIPLNTWTTNFDCSAAELISASMASEWKKELFETWTSAAVRQQAADWADALVSAAVDLKQFDKLEALFSVLSPERREARVIEMISSDNSKTHDLQGMLILQSTHAWSAEFTRSILAWLRKATAEPSGDWQLRNELKRLAARLAPETLAETSLNWPTESKGWEFWSKGVEEFIASAHFRKEMHDEFKSL